MNTQTEQQDAVFQHVISQILIPLCVDCQRPGERLCPDCLRAREEMEIERARELGKY